MPVMGLRLATWVMLMYFTLLGIGSSIPPRSKEHTNAVAGVTINASPSTGNAYPRAVALSDGSIIMGYTYVTGNTHVIQVVRSTDNGATFTPYSAIASRSDGGDMDNVFLVEVPGASPPVVLAAFRNHDVQNGIYTYYRITVCRSLDGGRTWSYLSQAVQYGPPGGQQLGAWEPFMRIAADGRTVQLYYSQELAYNNQQIFRTISTNGGASWSSGVNLQLHPNNIAMRDGMCGIAATSDTANNAAALVIVFESESTGIFNVDYAVSYDDGATWRNRALFYSGAGGSRNAGAPQIARFGATPGLVAVFMTDEDVAQANYPNAAEVKMMAAGAGLRGGVVLWDRAAPTLLGAVNSHWPAVIGYKNFVLTLFDTNSVLRGTVFSN
ncbi:Sialidase [Xylariales sp. PMI_506]|nr:Sialidase [Xylariales sp. PMI_506]